MYKIEVEEEDALVHKPPPPNVPTNLWSYLNQISE